MDRALLEVLRELMIVRGHNRTFRTGESQATYLLIAEGSLVLVAFERFLRVVLGGEATDKDTLPNLLEKATSARLHLLTINADDRRVAIQQLTDARNTIQHANYEQAAKQEKLASVAEYFGKALAGEVEKLGQILTDLIEQVDAKVAMEIRNAPDRRLV